jgi:phage gp29-like protein
MLVAIGLAGCNKLVEPVEPVELRSEIYNQKVSDDCEKSDSKNCLTDTIKSRADRYCSAKGLSESDCNDVKSEVLGEVGAKILKEVEETQKAIKVTKKQNAELDKILKK